jgi:predicted TIM-barrel fold metal-dependent hydrolase
MTIDRRDFLAGGALLAAAATAGTARSATAAPLEGEALRATPIFDINAHLSEAPPRTAAGYDVARDLAHRKSVMARWGIRRTVLMAPYLFDMSQGPADTRRQNDYVAWYCDAHRDLFPVGVGGVQPAQGQEAGIGEIRRMKNELGLAGLMFHPEYTGGITSARMVAFAKECANLKMPVFIHMEIPGGTENGTDMEALARRVPECTFVALGGFSSHRTATELRGAAKSCPNILFDTSFCYPMGKQIANFASVCGSERILFGSCMESTDDTYVYPAGYYDILYGNDLTDDDRQNILWKNAHRLFGLT